MYYNIAERTLRPRLTNCYSLVADVAANVQSDINKKLGIGIKGIKPTLNESRVSGIIEKITSAEQFDDVSWMLGEPVVNFVQAVADDAVRENAEFQYEAGLSPQVKRIVSGKCCEWCEQLAGTYDAADAPPEIYARHDNCTCVVLYKSEKNGKYTDVWSKKEFDSERKARIAREKELAQPKIMGKVDAKNKVAASTRFLNRTDKLYEYAKKIKPVEGFEDIVVHGDEFGFIFKNSDWQETNVSVLELANIIKKQNINNGKPIRLISCNTGSVGSITAQGLADIMEIDILAPSDIAFVDFEGNLTVGEDNKGEWILF